MPSRPRLLLITNEPTPGAAAGQIDGYRLLEETGELDRVDVVSARAGFDREPQAAVSRVIEALHQTRPDVVVIWTPGRFPGIRADFDRIHDALGRARLAYWEGDAWHRRKPITEQMTWWLTEADAVFSVSGPPQATDFMAVGAREVRSTIGTYCHEKFRDCETHEPPPVSSRRVTMIGNTLTRIPGVTGLPGSLRRSELAVRLSRAVTEFDLRGAGWRRLGLDATPLQYERQADHLRGSALSANWDHLPHYSDYSSDRLPIALIAGRVHVTTRHPGMAWAPGEDQGLYQRDSPKEIVATVRDLLGSRERLSALGLEAHRWARHRVSHREAARHVVSSIVDGVTPPPQDPWSHLPGPWTKA